MSGDGSAPLGGARTDSTELAPIAATPPALVGLPDLVAMFFAGMKPRTRAAYGRDLSDFARHVGAVDASAAVERLLSAGHGPANALALGWRAAMVEAGRAPATIARRLAALRSVVKLARTIGRVAWSLEVKPPKVERHRDTRGPGAEGYARMLRAAELAGDGRRALRDLAILRLLHDRGLRRGEAVSLDLCDYDPRRPSVDVVGKGRHHAETLRIGKGTAGALDRWAAARGYHPGPLFVRLDQAEAAPVGRLTGESVRGIVKRLADAAGLADGCRPHGLRHQAITSALDSGRDVREVQRFSRHKDVRTLIIYDDNRKDIGGDIADALGS